MARNTRLALSVQLLALLAREPKTQRTSVWLGEQLKTNPVFLRRILFRLLKAKIIMAKKGPGGGMTLLKDPKAITLAEIYQALDDPKVLPLDPRLHTQDKINRVLRDSIAGARAAMIKHFDTVTLPSLISSARRK